MVQLFSGQELSNKIKSMFGQSSPLRCAVAFWGPEYARLAKINGAKVILDISMHGTSKGSLRNLNAPEKKGDPENPNVLVLNKLHSKIFIGEDGAIIGSANSSINALGLGKISQNLFEAGVWIDRRLDCEAYKAAENLFLEYEKKAHIAGIKDFNNAVEYSFNEAARDHTGSSGDIQESILSELLSAPKKFSNVVFVFSDWEATDDEIIEADQSYKEEHNEKPEKNDQTMICTNLDAQQFAAFEEAAYIIMFWFGKDAELQVYDKKRTVEEQKAIYGRDNWKAVRKRLRLNTVSDDKKIWENDKSRAKTFMRQKCGNSGKGKRFVVLTAEQCCAELES
jgi:hypothetical protein